MASYSGIDDIVNGTAQALNVTKTILRNRKMPLDSTEVFESFEQAQKYAKGEKTSSSLQNGAGSYVGQKLTVISKELSTADMYLITDGGGTLLKIADQDDLDEISSRTVSVSADAEFDIESTNPIQNAPVAKYANVVDENLLILNTIRTEVAHLSVGTDDNIDKIRQTLSSVIGIFKGRYGLVIETPKELVSFANIVNSGDTLFEKTVVLANNIDMEGTAMSCIGTASHPFCGTFEGNGHRISNLKLINWTNGKSCCGLFGCVSNKDENDKIGTSEIRNLWIDNAVISSNYSYTGVIAGHINGCNIKNCKVTNTTVTCRVQSGGLVGSGEGNIEDSSFDGTLNLINTNDGTWDAWNGGLFGNFQGSSGIYNSRASGTINLLSSSTRTLVRKEDVVKPSIGGIVGRMCFINSLNSSLSTYRIYGNIVNCSSDISVNCADGLLDSNPIIGVFDAFNDTHIDNLAYAMIKNTTYGNVWDKNAYPIDQYKLINEDFIDSLSTLGYNDKTCYPCDGYPQYTRDLSVRVTKMLSSDWSEVPAIKNSNIVFFDGIGLDLVETSCVIGLAASSTWKNTPVVNSHAIAPLAKVERDGHICLSVTVPKEAFIVNGYNRFTMTRAWNVNAAAEFAYNGQLLQVPVDFILEPAVTVDPLEQTLSGALNSDYEATVSVYYDDKLLTEGIDYTIAYTGNKGKITKTTTTPITATANITGIGEYSGKPGQETITKTFKFNTVIV